MVSEHYSVDLIDEEGWWHGRCKCGADLGLFPSAEDACDALMDHAYRAGYESRGYLPLPPEGSNPASEPEKYQGGYCRTHGYAGCSCDRAGSPQ